jgi:hypothetical protein
VDFDVFGIEFGDDAGKLLAGFSDVHRRHLGLFNWALNIMICPIWVADNYTEGVVGPKETKILS